MSKQTATATGAAVEEVADQDLMDDDEDLLEDDDDLEDDDQMNDTNPMAALLASAQARAADYDEDDVRGDMDEDDEDDLEDGGAQIPSQEQTIEVLTRHEKRSTRYSSRF